MKSLEHKLGASLSEFLILAPVLVFLGMVAFDVNRRVEESQRISIASRNATQVSEKRDRDALLNTMRYQLEEKAAIADPNHTEFVRDHAETRQIRQTISDFSEDFGILAIVKDYHSPDQTKLQQAGRIIMHDERGQRSSLNRVADVNGMIAKGGSTFVETVQSTSAEFGLLLEDKPRQAVVGMRSAGKHNAIQRGISILAESIEGKEEAGQDVLGIERKFMSRSYIRPEDGYHPSDYRYAALWGAGLGYLGASNRWGHQEFQQNSKYLQSRCMTRFNSDNDCNNGNSVYEVKLDAYPHKIKFIADTKLAISTVMKVLGIFTAGGTALIDEISSEIAREIVSEISQRVGQALVEAVVDEMKNAVGNIADEKLKEIETEAQRQVGEIATQLNPTDYKGALTP